jgi:hypothetical protein
MIGLAAPGDSTMTQICIVAKDVETAKRVKRLEHDYGGQVSRIVILRECEWDSEGFDDASIVQLCLSEDDLEHRPDHVRAKLLAADIQADLVFAAVDPINEAPVIQEVAKVCASIVSIRATNGLNGKCEPRVFQLPPDPYKTRASALGSTPKCPEETGSRLTPATCLGLMHSHQERS